MNCGFCGSKLIWNNDFDFEDYCVDGEGVVTVYTCSNEDCGALWEGYCQEK